MAKPKRFEGIRFEQYVANFYINKINSCASRNIDFELTISDVRNLLSRKNCVYSGLAMTHTGAGVSGTNQRFSDVTIERVDSSIPYVKGNVVAVCHGFNALKSTYEQSNNAVGFKHLYKFVDTLRKFGVK